MNHQDEFEGLSALDALGALEPDESRRYAELNRSATREMLVEAEDLREAAAMLGTLLPSVTPPAAIREAVLRMARETPVATPDAAKITIRATELPWLPHPVPGLEFRQLSVDVERGSATIMMRISPGATYPSHGHHGGEDCYVISGDAQIGDVHLEAGDFHHASRGAQHGMLTTRNGCTLLLVVDKDDYAA